jgi:hypothetical protein
MKIAYASSLLTVRNKPTKSFTPAILIHILRFSKGEGLRLRNTRSTKRLIIHPEHFYIGSADPIIVVLYRCILVESFLNHDMNAQYLCVDKC